MTNQKIVMTLLTLSLAKMAFAISIEDLHLEVAESRSRFVTAKPGWDIEFYVEQSRENFPDFPYPKNLTGSLRLQWPKIYVQDVSDIPISRGNRHGFRKDAVRESSYDFEKGIGYTRDGSLLAQRCNYRPNLTSKMALPIRMAYFHLAASEYAIPPVPDQYWLPGCLKVGNYTVRPEEIVAGQRCILVESPTDKMWFCEEMDFVLVARELQTSTTKELYSADKFKLVNGCWFPMHQKVSVTLAENRKVTRALTIQKLKSKELGDSKFEISIPQDTQVLEDSLTKQRITRSPEFSQDKALATVASELTRERELNDQWFRRLSIIVMIFVGVLLGVVWRTRRH